MAKKHFLIFDLGASGGRALVAHFDKGRYELDEVHRFENKPVYATGTWYWDLLRLFSEVKSGVTKAVHTYGDISSIAIDTWGVDFGFIDGNGKVLSNPVCYRDERGNGLMPEVLEIIPEKELFSRTGIFILSISSIFHLYGMKKDGCGALKEAARFLMMPDLLNYLLTGSANNEYTTATTTVLYNQMDRRWAFDIMDKLGLPQHIFAETVLPGAVTDPIQKSISGELGVPPIPVIMPASHDTASVEVGVPVTGPKENWAFLNVGTWAVAGMETEKPIISDEVFTSGFGNEGSATGGSFLACNINGLFVIQQCRERWMAERGSAISWDEIVEGSLTAPALQSLLDVDDSVFSQQQADMPETITEYLGTKGQMPASGIPGIARCLYESLVLKFRYRIEQLGRLTGVEIAVIHMVGGGTQNKRLCQWTTDATGIRVVAGPVETTAAGNLLVQLMSCGEVETVEEGRLIIAGSSQLHEYDPSDRQPWDDAYSRYIRLFHNRHS